MHSFKICVSCRTSMFPIYYTAFWQLASVRIVEQQVECSSDLTVRHLEGVHMCVKVVRIHDLLSLQGTKHKSSMSVMRPHGQILCCTFSGLVRMQDDSVPNYANGFCNMFVMQLFRYAIVQSASSELLPVAA